jgi:hypothetical protein
MQFFTREQAEALLPQLRDLLLEMQRCKREIDDLRGDLGQAVERSTGNGHVKDETDLAGKRRRAEAFVEQLNEHLARINALGVELKDVDQGLLDFPHEREGRVVYLCWRLGEESIAWWHELDTGFAGRQALDP